MAAYFQSVMQEESIIKEAMKAFEAEAMKALETKSYVFVDDVFNAAGINLPSGMTKDAFLDKLEESLHYTLKVNWNTYEVYGQPSIVRVGKTAQQDLPLHQMTASVVAPRLGGQKRQLLFEERDEMSGSEHGDGSSDDADDNSSENGFDSGESDQSSDDELGNEMHLAEEDIPENFLGIDDSNLRSQEVHDDFHSPQDDNDTADNDAGGADTDISRDEADDDLNRAEDGNSSKSLQDDDLKVSPCQVQQGEEAHSNAQPANESITQVKVDAPSDFTDVIEVEPSSSS
ncbi:unnamed protein product [Aphanomyces euteiches]